MAETVDTARAAAEKTLGFRIPDHVAEEVLAHTRRKCALNQKPNSYLPLLYENELTDYYTWLTCCTATASTERTSLQNWST